MLATDAVHAVAVAALTLGGGNARRRDPSGPSGRLSGGEGICSSDVPAIQSRSFPSMHIGCALLIAPDNTSTRHPTLRLDSLPMCDDHTIKAIVVTLRQARFAHRRRGERSHGLHEVLDLTV